MARSELETQSHLRDSWVEHGDDVPEVVVEQVEIRHWIGVQRVVEVEHCCYPSPSDPKRLIDSDVQQRDIVRSMIVQILDEERRWRQVGQLAVRNNPRVWKSALISEVRCRADVERQHASPERL